MPPWGGVPYCRVSRKKPKRAFASSCSCPGRGRSSSHILAVNTDGTGAEFKTVHGEVIVTGADRGGIGLEPVHVLFVRRGEGMVRGRPGAGFGIVLEHGEIRDPEGTEGSGAIDVGVACTSCVDSVIGDGEGAVAIGVLLCQFHAEVACGAEDGDFAFGQTTGTFVSLA